MDWKEDTQKLQSSHSKLLYMIFFFYKIEELTEHEMTKLKEYVILEDVKIFDLLSEFESTLDEIKLLEELKKLYEEEIKFSHNTSNQEREICTLSNESKNSQFSLTNNGKKIVTVNIEKSFLNNAMNSIKKRGPEFEDNTKNEVNMPDFGSPVGSSLLDRKKKQQKEKSRGDSPENSKDEMYKKSFLGRAVGSLGESP